MPDEVLELSDTQIFWAIQNIKEDEKVKNDLIKDVLESLIYIIHPQATIKNKNNENKAELEEAFFDDLIKNGANAEDIEKIKGK